MNLKFLHLRPEQGARKSEGLWKSHTVAQSPCPLTPCPLLACHPSRSSAHEKKGVRYSSSLLTLQMSLGSCLHFCNRGAVEPCGGRLVLRAGVGITHPPRRGMYFKLLFIFTPASRLQSCRDGRILLIMMWSQVTWLDGSHDAFGLKCSSLSKILSGQLDPQYLEHPLLDLFPSGME